MLERLASEMVHLLFRQWKVRPISQLSRSRSAARLNMTPRCGATVHSELVRTWRNGYGPAPNNGAPEYEELVIKQSPVALLIPACQSSDKVSRR